MINFEALSLFALAFAALRFIRNLCEAGGSGLPLRQSAARQHHVQAANRASVCLTSSKCITTQVQTRPCVNRPTVHILRKVVPCERKDRMAFEPAIPQARRHRRQHRVGAGMSAVVRPPFMARLSNTSKKISMPFFESGGRACEFQQWVEVTFADIGLQSHHVAVLSHLARDYGRLVAHRLMSGAEQDLGLRFVERPLHHVTN